MDYINAHATSTLLGKLIEFLHIAANQLDIEPVDFGIVLWMLMLLIIIPLYSVMQVMR